MAVRRSLARELDAPRQRRRSLRLASKQGTPFRSAACRTPSTVTNLATPRTVFRKVLQTQPIVSPLVPEKPDSPKPLETVLDLPSGIAPHSSLELSLSAPAPKYTSRATYLNARTKKKARLSEFERVLDKQLTTNTAASLLGNTSLTRSLQISFATPEPLENAGKRGLIRRPKNYRGVDVKAFEGGIEQNLLQIKGSQCHLVNLQATTLLSNDTETDLTATELFAQPQLSGQGGSGHSVLRSRPTSIRKSSQTQQSLLPFIQTPLQDAEFDMDVNGVTQTGQKENLTAEVGCADGTETAPEERAAHSREEQQEGLQGAKGGLKCSNLKEATPGTEDADRMDTGSQTTAMSPESQQRESLHENSDMEPFLSSGEYLVSGIGTARTSTPAGVKLPQVHPGNLSSLMHKKTSKRSVKEMVTHILKELDSSMAAATVSQGGSEANLKEKLPPRKVAMQISQRTEAGTPSRQEPEQLLRPSTRKMVDEQAGYGGEMREAEDVSNAEIGPEAEELSEVETESENDEPTEKTPTFVHTRAFQCSPLLATPHPLKVSASKSSSKQPLIKRVPKQTERVRREKREPSLPSSLVKKIFSHYARMPVSKDAFKAVERCVNLYFKHLSEDLEVYTHHAGRKTTEPADLELLMRRQGLITDKMPLNVLIERYMPLEYRKLLIPVATSGNKVVPLKL
ncbi:centromere protein T [Tiliqua scincoides]|uniref:centromere protein T n=1 Tax=Tiliqua scincoides TaxID=71010 RepID=UPI003462F784